MSSCSTPKRKKSMSVNCVWTYIAKLNILFRQQHGRHFYVMLTVHLFLRMLSEFKIHLGLWLGLTHSLLNSLEDVLSGLDDADNVAQTSVFVQRAFLKEVLGDGCSALVDSIIQSIKKVTTPRSNLWCGVPFP